MNWYIEKDGVSQGPLTEQVLALRVQGGEVPDDTLIWHVGLEEWQPIRQLRPKWLEPPAPPVLVPIAASPLPPAESKAAALSRAAAKPLAPSVPEAQPGFFQKLFGRGRKKP